MLKGNLTRGAAAFAILAFAGCKSLDVVNPNEPDTERALSDPLALEALAGGTLRSWFNTYEGMSATGVLTTQAQNYTSSWNNFNMNFYSGVDNPSAGPAGWNRNSRGWQNDPTANARTSIEWFWTGYYSTLSSATDVVRAIRKNNIVITNPTDTKRAEAVALLMQGASLAGIALNYDKGFIVDENADLANLQLQDRKKIRDAAVAKLIDAANVAKSTTFSTPVGWSNGTSYSSSQIARIAYTMAAMTLAYWPRNAAENGQVAWGTVATYASQGMSTGGSFDFVFTGDGCANWCHEILYWFNGIDGGRVSTRVANMMDPVTQLHPWPAGGNRPPTSADHRLGDGSFGDESLVDGFGTYPVTGNEGTDFAWSGVAPFRPDRGSYHQSNIAHTRYDLSGLQDPTGIYGGFGPAPVISAGQNDLIWAEALIRGPSPDLARAAQLINKTRVTRGGLSSATAAEGAASLLNKLHYENEIEVMGLGASTFYNRRRIDGLLPGTPREMPIPAKELGVLGIALYTFGGSAAPSSPTPP